MKSARICRATGPVLRPVLVFSLAFFFAALPAVAQNCGNVSYRLWTKDGDTTWYRLGDTVEIESGREGHIYVHVDSRSKSPYSTRAEIGYPEKFGLSGRSTDVVRHVRMQAQNGEDRSSGRIRFDAAQPGTTQLGFRIEGVKSPGDLGLVAQRCRTGAIPIHVVARGGQGGGPGGGQGGGQGQPATGPAEELVSRLYRGLLRRRDAGRLDQGFVQQVRRDARNGVLEVADTMVRSEEFRRDALRRTEEAHGRNSLDELRRLLLGDVYRDLYGYAEPDRQGRDDDMRDLEDCLSGRPGNEACSRLGRELVNRRLFYENNQNLIDALSSPGRPGRRR